MVLLVAAQFSRDGDPRRVIGGLCLAAAWFSRHGDQAALGDRWSFLFLAPHDPRRITMRLRHGRLVVEGRATVDVRFQAGANQVLAAGAQA